MFSEDNCSRGGMQISVSDESTITFLKLYLIWLFLDEIYP